MRLPVVIVALFGLAALGLAVVLGGAHLTGGVSESTPFSRPAEAESPAIAPPPATGAPPAKARPVAPEVIAPPDLASDGLERVAPRAPLGDLALAVPPKPGIAEKTLLHRPIATAAGRLEAQGHSIVIEGIVPVEPEQDCLGTDGSSWPCGTVARTAFRNWLRGRAVECTVATPPAGKTITSPCALGAEDVALWLVQNGFAAAEPDSAYVEAGKEARAERRGIFGPGPSAVP